MWLGQMNCTIRLAHTIHAKKILKIPFHRNIQAQSFLCRQSLFHFFFVWSGEDGIVRVQDVHDRPPEENTFIVLRLHESQVRVVVLSWLHSGPVDVQPVCLAPQWWRLGWHKNCRRPTAEICDDGSTMIYVDLVPDSKRLILTSSTPRYYVGPVFLH